MIERLASARSLLVASDFDGTLAEIVDNPHDAVPLPRSHEALRRLTRAKDTTVAVVSGRRRTELVKHFGEDGFVLIGEHGADAGGAILPESPSLTSIRGRVIEIAESTPGSRVEYKNRSMAFHHRGVEDAHQALARLRRLVEESDGIRGIEGKAVFEVTDSTTDKGKAVTALRLSLAVDRVIFVGDDITDEAVFDALGPGDLSVHVGGGASSAMMTIPNPEAVADLLEVLATLRENH